MLIKQQNKPLLWLLVALCLTLTHSANAAYQRNQARPVNKVVFGEVTSVRYITHQEIVHSSANGWETLLGSVVGGLVGYQFGDGSGQQIATAVGAIAGASYVQHQRSQSQIKHYRLVELLISSDSGQLIDVIQDVDSNMIFSKGDEIRILYFDDGVRVDKTF